jgi:hypothetical protein
MRPGAGAHNRYRHDPEFYRLVNTMRALVRNAAIPRADLALAAGLALELEPMPGLEAVLGDAAAVKIRAHVELAIDRAVAEAIRAGGGQATPATVLEAHVHTFAAVVVGFAAARGEPLEAVRARVLCAVEAAITRATEEHPT